LIRILYHMGQSAEMSEDPSSLTRWVVAHPALWGLLSGLAVLAAAIGLFRGDHPVAWVGASAAFGVFNYVLWRRRGPGHELRAYVLRRFPNKTRGEHT
jgi:hypothetical protein